MFKSFFQTKFKFSNEVISNFFSSHSNTFNSSTLGNLAFNYAAYMKGVAANQENKFKILAEKSQKNIALISQRQREIVNESDWIYTRNQESNTSSIERKFAFDEESQALEFISVVKEKCDEIDHHPSWTYTADNIKKEYVININLTSHFAQNNVTDKDYELAAFLTYEYERLRTFFFNNHMRSLITISLNTLLVIFVYKYVLRKYNKHEEKKFDAYYLCSKNLNKNGY